MAILADSILPADNRGLLAITESVLGGGYEIEVTVTTGGTGERVGHWLGAGQHNLSVIIRATGVNSPAARPVGFWSVAIVPDVTDVIGNYTTASTVFLIPGGALATTSSTQSFTLPTSGVYRVVVMAGDSQTNANNASAVDTSAASTQWHHDSDAAANTRRGQAATVTSTQRILAIVCALATVSSITTSVPSNQRYGQTPTVSYVLSPTGSSTFRNTYQIDVGVQHPGSGFRVSRTTTPTTSGTATTSSYNVDTVFSTGQVGHRLFIGSVNLSTLLPSTNNRPQLLRGGFGSVAIGDSQTYWCRFVSTGSGPGITYSANYASLDALVTISRDISLSNVQTHDDAARTKPSKLFRRPFDGAYQRPYLRVTVLDGYGNPLPSTSVQAQVRVGGTSTAENTQTLTTTAAGVVTWDYATAATHVAYNRFKNGGDTSTLTVPQADVADALPVPHIEGNFDFRGPYPSKAKDVFVRGNAFSGSNEPNVTTTDVFGLVSEMVASNIWTGDAGQATANANDAPTGTVARFKNLGTGSSRVKVSSQIDEGNARVADLGQKVLRDTAGRPYTTSSPVEGSYASYNVTLASVDQSLSNYTNPQRPQGALGYPTQFITVSPPGDPSVVSYTFTFADTTAQRGSFVFTSHTVNGFTSDSGVYGRVQQSINYTAVDPNLTFSVAASSVSSPPDRAVTIVAEMRRILGTNARVSVTPDAPLHIYIDRRDPLTGLLSTVVNQTMAPVAGSTSEFQYVFTAGEAASYAATVTGFINGSRPPDAGDIALFTGARNTDYDLVIDVIKADDTAYGSHVLPGEPFIVSAYVVDDSDGSLVTMDAGTSEVALVRDDGAGTVETFDPNTSQWVTVGGAQGVVYVPMITVGQAEHKEFTLPQQDGARDIVLNVRCQIDGVVYTQGAYREVVSGSFQHDADSSENVGIVVNAVDPVTGSALQSHLRSGLKAQFISVPRTSTGVDPNGGDYTTQWAIRRVGASGTFDWDGAAWVSASGAGAALDLLAPTVDFGNGATLYELSETTVQEAIDDAAQWMVVSALVTYGVGTIRERQVLESIQVDLFTEKNSHDGYRFDGSGFVGFPQR